jgi:integrase/recombinase XerD
MSMMARYETVEELTAEWQVDLSERVARSTCETYVHGVERYMNWCRQERVRWQEAESIGQWRSSLLRQGLSVGSINTWFAGVRAFFSWAVSARSVGHDPTLGMRTLARPKGREPAGRVPLTDREVLRVLAQPDDSEIGLRDSAILALMVYAAARTVDIQRAAVGDVKEIADGAYVLSGDDGQESLAIVHAHAVAALQNWLEVHPMADSSEAPLFVALGNRARGSRLTARAIRRLVRGHLMSAGIRDAQKTAHSLRSSAICNALRQGQSLEQVRAMSRHRDLASLSTHLSDAQGNGLGGEEKRGLLIGHASAAIDYDASPTDDDGRSAEPGRRTPSARATDTTYEKHSFVGGV